jgi:hypothetical protein
VLALGIQDWALLGLLIVVVVAGYVILGKMDASASLGASHHSGARLGEELGVREFSRFEQDVRVGVERHRAATVTDEGGHPRDRRTAEDEQ